MTSEPDDRNHRALLIGTVALAIMVVLGAFARACQAGFPPLH